MYSLKKLIPQPIKNIYHLAQAVLANFMYGFPSKSIKVIGVTGTNGKTTTVQMITKILEEAGHEVAMASTINFKLAEKEWVNKTKFTTLSAFQVQKFILDAVKTQCEYLVLETSSHSLDQYRVWGVEYSTAVITNVTREHLDYHKTMEEYRQAKLKLFKKAKIAIVNLGMEQPEDFMEVSVLTKKMFGYSAEFPIPSLQFLSETLSSGFPQTIIIAENIEEGTDSSRFAVNGSQFKLNLIGKFNIENSLAAICVGLSENISLETCAKALEKIKGVPGRMEYVPNNKGLNIIIDYAVTPDSLEKLYNLINQIKKTLPSEKARFAESRRGDVRRTEGFLLEPVVRIKIPPAPFYKGGGSKIIAVFGACGERDRGKRPIMGEIVAKYADYIILTNEDPYNEEPMGIINEIEVGINPVKSAESGPAMQEFNGVKNKELSKNYWKILDRREAIKKALQLAKPGDYVIVTGKGAEEIMAIGNERIEWNDKEVILEELDGLSLKTNR